MKTKTAFVLALCAVAIAAVPDSDIVPEDTHHAHLRDIRSAMDALTHLPHTETARKDMHLRELRFAVDALTSKVNTMAMQLQTAPPSMSLVQMLPTNIKRDVVKPTGPSVLDDKLNRSSQKFLAMRTAIKDKMHMGRAASDRGLDETTLAKKKNKLKEHRNHISGNSHSSKHLGRIGGQCYEEIENYVLGMEEFLDDFKSELKLKFNTLNTRIKTQSAGCHIVEDMTKGKIRQTCSFSILDKNNKEVRKLKTISKGLSHNVDVDYSTVKSQQAHTKNTLSQIVNLEKQLHAEMEHERECGANRAKRVLETADDVAAFIHKHVAMLQEEVNGFCDVVKDADAPVTVVYKPGSNQRIRLSSKGEGVARIGEGEASFDFDGDKELQKVCTYQKPKRYQKFFKWLYEVAFGTYSRSTFPFFEVSASKTALKKLEFGSSHASTQPQTFGPEVFATSFAKNEKAAIQNSQWSWLKAVVDYYNEHSDPKTGDWKDAQCVSDAGLKNPLLKAFGGSCKNMFDSVLKVQNNMEGFWKQQFFKRHKQ